MVSNSRASTNVSIRGFGKLLQLSHAEAGGFEIRPTIRDSDFAPFALFAVKPSDSVFSSVAAPRQRSFSEQVDL